jgi:predicted dehydrogenase
MRASKHTSRRRFLIQAAAAVTGPLILPSGVLAAPGRRGANDQIGVGYIGVGRRSGQLMGLPEGARIVAFADVDQRKLDARKARHPDAKTYTRYRDLLADPAVDAVVIATPDHWHALNAVHACEAGKDVYCEKPMTLTVAEGRRCVEAARKHQRIFQVGSQQRSMPANRAACDFIRGGGLGTILRVHAANYPSPWEPDFPAQPVPEGLDWDAWCGPVEPLPYHIDLFLPRAEGRKDAQGRPLGWISFRPFSGGEMTGWGSHGLDQIQCALGMDATGPAEIWPEGEGLTAPVHLRYANGVTIQLDGDGPPGGGLFIGSEGSLRLDRGKLETRPRGLLDQPDRGGHERHLAHWIDCIRSRETPVADVEAGHRAATLCHLGNIARWTGRKLQWDPEAERFVNDDAANGLLDRPRRAAYDW